MSGARQRWVHQPATEPAKLAVAFVTMVVFLRLNGWDFEAPESEVVTAMLALAAGKSKEADLTGWLRSRSTRVKPPKPT